MRFIYPILRAGEAGRGFAVVADEVRSLAQHSQTATEEIQAMTESLHKDTSNITMIMESSIECANKSMEQVELARAALVEIGSIVGSINDTNKGVADATNKQSTAVLQISENIHNVSEIAAKISTAVETTNDACVTQSNMVHELYEIVNQFKT